MAETAVNNLHVYLTPEGADRMRRELDKLLHQERPKIVEIVSWAAGNGDRSENGDYIYGKRRLHEIDRHIRFLRKRLGDAVIVDPQSQTTRDRVFFGATVIYLDEADATRTVRIVGCDEARIEVGEISVVSPLARALLRRQVGDEVILQAQKGDIVLEIVSISYQNASSV